MTTPYDRDYPNKAPDDADERRAVKHEFKFSHVTTQR